jgi:hypothetical protein
MQKVSIMADQTPRMAEGRSHAGGLLAAFEEDGMIVR